MDYKVNWKSNPGYSFLDFLLVTSNNFFTDQNTHNLNITFVAEENSISTYGAYTYLYLICKAKQKA